MQYKKYCFVKTLHNKVDFQSLITYNILSSTNYKIFLNLINYYKLFYKNKNKKNLFFG